jgi:GTPase SAR1 family protein
VVLLGDSGVGKTALVNRFVFNTFRQVLFLVFFVSMISFKGTGSRDRMESFVDMQRYNRSRPSKGSWQVFNIV